MRLKRLDLSRYGKFTDRAIDFGERRDGAADLHIVYGLNEAGKSTALNAFLDLLFGIEERTRYAFLHSYGAMEIGAALEWDGASHEFLRRKQRANSLTDPSGRAVNEAVLTGALSGLGREAYRTMFSLDDETLEDGGNAILQSRGDLGELLFSASAGLAGIGAVLAEASEKADAIHRRQARKTEIAVLKDRLKESKTRREAIDTGAAAYAGLEQAARRAARAYEEAMTDRGGVQADLDKARRILGARPLAEDYRRTGEALAAYAALPRPPEAWSRELPALAEADTRVAALLETAGERAAVLRRDIEELTPDAGILSCADEIRALGEALGRYSTAEADLPRRRLSLEAREATLARLLGALGQGGHADPASLILPAAISGTIRELIENRSGVEARLRTAERELTDAAGAIERLREEAARADGGSAPVPGEGLQALERVARRQKSGESALRLRLAERDLPATERRAREALAALAPWNGDAAALRTLGIPDARRLESWRARLTTLTQKREAHGRRAEEHAGDLGETRARLGALRAGGEAIGDDEAARLRAARDAAWTSHRADLGETSADRFEAAMQADDRVAQARLSRMRDLAELRQLTAAEAVTAAALSREEALGMEAVAAIDALRGEIAAGSPVAFDGADPAIAIERIEAFAGRRLAALDALQAEASAEDAAEAARRDAERDRAELAEALAACGEAPGTASLADLLDRTEALIAREAKARSQAEGRERALRDADAALARRRRERGEAETAFRAWQAQWDAALRTTWIAPDLPLGGVREILDAVSGLGSALRERDDMRHRIETMEADQTRLTHLIARIHARLGETGKGGEPASAAADLTLRLEGAERQDAARRERLAELDRLEEKERGLDTERRFQAGRKAEMTALFGVETLAEVAAALEQAAERQRLERRLKETGEALAIAMQARSPEEAIDALAALDIDAAEKQAGELSARHEDLDARSRALFAEKTRAEDALDAVGGDDAAARLGVERQTVLMEMEDAALRYLRLRTGALLAHDALRAYRDRHRSSMMGRASEAFAAMTRGDYTGLSARPEKDRETLIGLPRGGGSKLATDMSKGTRFQLYLALRLAGYEEFAAARGAVPFLADDIMETFDEPRSQEVLRLLARMSRTGQVVYFTHHRHLCDIAKAVEPGVRIHEI